MSNRASVPGAGGRWDTLNFPLRALHVFTLSMLAIAKPVFDVTARDAAFFVIRGSRPADIVSLVLFLAVIVPSLLLAVAAPPRLLGKRAGRYGHYGIIALLVLLYSLQLSKGLGTEMHGATTLVLSAAIAAGLTALYAGTRPARMVVSAISPIIVVLPLVFLLGSDVGKIVFPHRPAAHGAGRSVFAGAAPGGGTSVVMIIMDQLPLVSLLDGTGKIDARRFPNLAELSRTAHWFTRAFTASYATEAAVPAILTGTMPTKRQLPNIVDHPDNLFTMLAADYDFSVYESATALCPDSLSMKAGMVAPFGERFATLLGDLGVVYLHILSPREYARRLPPIGATWEGFFPEMAKRAIDSKVVEIKLGDRVRDFRDFVSRLERGRRPSLIYYHLMLPHGPFEFLPSGRRYRKISERGLPGLERDGGRFLAPQPLMDAYHSLHLLQLRCADTLIGELAAKLREIGLYDESLIVLTADHGIAYITEEQRMRHLEEYHARTYVVPLLMKLPNQTEGKEIAHPVHATDILPTIADVLGIPVERQLTGTSLLSGSYDRSRTELPMFSTGDDTIIRLKLDWTEAGLTHAVKTNAANLGLDLPEYDGYTVGGYGRFIGRDVGSMMIGDSPCPVMFDGDAPFADIGASSGYLPVVFSGRLPRCRLSRAHVVAAVDGAVRSIAKTARVGEDCIFSLLLPEETFQDRGGQLDIYAAEPADDGGLVLFRTIRADARPAPPGTAAPPSAGDAAPR